MDVFRLNRLWRFIVTAWSFFCFGVGGAFFTFLFFPAVRFWARDRTHCQHIAQQTIRRSFKLFVGIMTSLGAIRVNIEGAEKLQDDCGCLIIANHPTLIDYVLITALLPRCLCIVKNAMWRNPFARGAISAAGYIANDDTKDMLARCDTALKDDNILLIFPEGTRSKPGKTLNFKRGAAQIAIRSDCAVRLIHIQCNPPFLFKNDKWYKIPPKQPVFIIKVGEKVHAGNFLDKGTSEAIAARRLNDYLQSTVMAMVPEEEIS